MQMNASNRVRPGLNLPCAVRCKLPSASLVVSPRSVFTRERMHNLMMSAHTQLRTNTTAFLGCGHSARHVTICVLEVSKCMSMLCIAFVAPRTRRMRLRALVGFLHVLNTQLRLHYESITQVVSALIKPLAVICMAPEHIISVATFHCRLMTAHRPKQASAMLCSHSHACSTVAGCSAGCISLAQPSTPLSHAVTACAAHNTWRPRYSTSSFGSTGAAARHGHLAPLQKPLTRFAAARVALGAPGTAPRPRSERGASRPEGREGLVALAAPRRAHEHRVGPLGPDPEWLANLASGALPCTRAPMPVTKMVALSASLPGVER